MPVRLSVVVPVHNPGPHLDDLVASLLRQSLPPAEFEVLFCDDGSDEVALQRLAAATAGRPQLRVLELEHSGWPGTSPQCRSGRRQRALRLLLRPR